MKVVLLLSGGLDSATLLSYATQNGYEVYPISFSYGQRHNIELEKAKQLTAFYNLQNHKIINLDLTAFNTSALINKELDIPKNESAKTIPITYVPARNTIFLSYAIGYAEVIEAKKILIGANAVDYSGYPDCRPEYYKAFETLANLATKRAVEGNTITFETPLIHLSKADIIKLGLSNGLDYSLTISCYDPTADGLSCGHCDSCKIRLNGFKEVGIEDPATYTTLKQAA